MAIRFDSSQGTSGSGRPSPSNATVRRFVDALEGEGIQVKVRFRKGDKINAACGQLRWSLREKE
ncbi:MAG: hypothetical protein II622_07755 [Thermoguttaceae bacterium]|nr:hypothetical protein [Thermoguttaceae bacterium]